MKRGAATRGKVAKLIRGAGAVEIKATVHQKQVKGALARYALTPKNSDERFIYFFDTPQLEMFRTGIIARARRKVGDEHDSTIKFRPIEPDRISKGFSKYAGLKIEADASEKGVVVSGSLTMPVEKGHIKLVAAGKEPIEALFTQEQKLFLLTLADRRLDYAKALVMGPVRAWRWKFSDPALPWPLTAELWRRDDGGEILEVSIKAPAVQAPAASAGFMAFLAEFGAERDEAQQAKTRWALDYYAKKHRAPTRPRPAPTSKGKPAAKKA